MTDLPQVSGSDDSVAAQSRGVESESKQEARAGQAASAAPALTSAEQRSGEALGQAGPGLAAERNAGAPATSSAASVERSEREQILEAFYDSITGILFLHDEGRMGHTTVLGEVRHSTRRCEEQLGEVEARV